ncbi:uncharacterized protein METZ01_LOCUS366294 [marine metagenome]|uniref:Uncharacterized protein n=1 Tax=marine metagenome TaxID=408172 RepID=A0A382SU55_9ZZZZ
MPIVNAKKEIAICYGVQKIRLY